MSMIDRVVNQAQRRLNTNVWLDQLATGVVIAATLGAAALLVERTLGLGLREGPSLLAAAGLGALVAVVLATWRMVSRPAAAVALDRAAQLKERLSSALALRARPDGFCRALLSDAENHAQRVAPAVLLPRRAPQHWPWSVASALALGLLYLLMPSLNLLAAAQAKTNDEPPAQARVEAETVKATVNERFDRVRQMTAENPKLADLAKDLEKIDLPDKATVTPEDVQREALKKIDSVQDKLTREQNSDKLAAFKELEKQLAKLDPQKGDDAGAKLSQSLAKGDMEAAKQALREMQKKLEDPATAKDPESKEQLAEMNRKLDDLAKQLDKLNNQQAMQKELANKAGLSEQQAKELLEKLSKMDPQQMQQQLQQALQNSGLSQQQMQQLAQKMQQQQQAQQQMQQLAQALQQAAQSMQQCQNPGQNPSGNPSQASAGEMMAQALQDMQAAMGQLSDMQNTQQMSGDLQAALSELRAMREGVCKGSGQCQGNGEGNCPGCSKCSGKGQGQNAGLGYGSRIGKDKQAHQYEAQKAQVALKSGEIIGQMLVDGPQIKGEATAAVREAAAAALRDATDAIERNQHPRQYDTAVRSYFDRLAGLLKIDPRPTENPPASAEPDDE